MSTNHDPANYSINPECIASFVHTGQHIEIRFRDDSVLKLRASACVLSVGKKLLIGKELHFPDTLLIGGKPSADGKDRCKNPQCNILLTDENRIDGYCWPCCQKLEGVDIAIQACRTLGMRNADEVVHKYLQAMKPEDAAALDGETLLNQVMKKGE